MTPYDPQVASAPVPPLVAPALVPWLSVFRPCFTAPVWNHILVLVSGAVLAPGKRTVTQALRVMGLDHDNGFGRYHEVLNRARWNARAVARLLLLHILERLLPNGPVVIGIDDTIERRWGAKIGARGIYRDPVRSTKGQFVKTSGLRWLALMVIVPIPWANRRWALPFLTILAPSERWAEANGRRHKTLTDWARQAILQTKRWLPDRRLIFVADSSFAAVELLNKVRKHVCVITRLRLDANLCEPPPAPSGKRGRPPVKGKVLPKLSAVLEDPKTVWTTLIVSQWYGEQQRKLKTATGTAVWYRSGVLPVPSAADASWHIDALRASIRWVLVHDPLGEHDPQAFLSTDLGLEPATILGWFVSRWRVETTFQEVRVHLGVETQRQWSDLAILRTTPALLGLFSLITIWANECAAAQHGGILTHAAAWYHKKDPTFSDAIAAVRRALWTPPDFSMSRRSTDTVVINVGLLKRLIQTLSLAA